MKRIFILVLALTLVLGLAGCGASGTAGKVLSAIDDHEYQKAADLFWENVSGNAEAEQNVHQGLLDRIQENYDAYNSGKKTLEDAMLVVNTIDKSCLLDSMTIHAATAALYELQESKDAFQSAQDLQSASRFLEAYECYLLVVEADTNYKTAQAEAKTCYNSYVDATCTEARDHAAKGRFQEGYFLLNKNLVKFPEDLTMKKAQEDILKDWLKTTEEAAQACADSGKHLEGYTLLQEEKLLLPNPSLLDEAIAQLLEAWKPVVQAAAEEAFGGKEKNYDGAIQAIQSSGIPAELMDEDLAYYQSFIPKPLTSLDYNQKAKYIRVGVFEQNAKDVNGKTYEEDNVICPAGGSLNTETSESEEDAYVTYYLNQEYSTLTGVVFRPYSSLSCDYTWEGATTVKIYGDGALLYEAPNFTQDTFETQSFRLDISGVRELKIVMRGVWTAETGWIGTYSRNPMVCMGELIIQR